MSNKDHRKDGRTDEEFEEHIREGVRLQGIVARKMIEHFKLCPFFVDNGFVEIRYSKDDVIVDGDYFDTHKDQDGEYHGDGRIVFADSILNLETLNLEIKTKGLEGNYFSLKRVDLQRAINYQTPFVLANQVDTDHMVMRCMDLNEIEVMHKIPPYPTPIAPDCREKDGYVLDQTCSGEWMLASETNPDKILRCYAPLLTCWSYVLHRLLPDISAGYPWEKPVREYSQYLIDKGIKDAEHARLQAIACANNPFANLGK